MGTNYIRAFCEREVAATGEAGTPIRFTASTAGIKRDGIDLDPNNWDLANYRRNPVVLWVHDYMGANLPIGRADAFVEGDALMADVTFDNEDPFAMAVESKYRRGFLNAVSVGWQTRNLVDDATNEPVTRYELWDVSAVPVPGDPDALIERQKRGIADMVDRLVEALDVNEGADSELTPADGQGAVVGDAGHRLARRTVEELQAVIEQLQGIAAKALEGTEGAEDEQPAEADPELQQILDKLQNIGG